MKEKMLTGLLALSMVARLTGCGGNKTAQAPTPQGQQEEAKKNEAGSKMAAMIISIAREDSSLTLAYADMEQLGEEYDTETKIIEALDKSEYSEQIRAVAETGASSVYVVWDDLATEATEIAPDFPSTKFIMVGCCATSDLGNVKITVVEPQETAFIAGIVAAGTSESRRASWVDSTGQPVINKFRADFEAGAAYADPSVECEPLYIDDANDPSKGSELAKQVTEKGADVVTHSTSKAGLGVTRAYEGEGAKAIGADRWQGAINEDTVSWSALRDTTGAVHHTGESTLDNIFTAGTGMYNISSGLKPCDDRDYAKLPGDTKKKVDETTEKMKNGEIKIPSGVEQ